jgi:hypothetical protein
VDDELKRDDDEVARIEQEAHEAKKRLEDGSKWPDQ